MKILNVNFSFNTIGEKLSDELSGLKELQKRGHTVATVATDQSNYIIEHPFTYDNIDEKTPIDIFGIPVYILHSTIPSLGWYCPNANKISNHIVKDFDVIHIRNWYHHLAITFYKSAVKHNVPFVFTAHGTLDSVARTKYMKKPKKFLDKLYTKKMINHAAALHSLGNSEYKEFLSFGAEPHKIFRIDLGVKPEDLEIKYSEALLDSIKNFWSDKTQKKLKLQRDTINVEYSWDLRVLEWKKFFDSARKQKVKT